MAASGVRPDFTKATRRAPELRRVRHPVLPSVFASQLHPAAERENTVRRERTLIQDLEENFPKNASTIAIFSAARRWRIIVLGGLSALRVWP